METAVAPLASAVGVGVTALKRSEIHREFKKFMAPRKLGPGGRVWVAQGGIKKMRRFYCGLTHCGTPASKAKTLKKRFKKEFNMLFLPVFVDPEIGHEYESVLTGAAMAAE